MQYGINYYLHQTYTPPYYHRQYNHDLPEEPNLSLHLETAKRTVHLVIPFLSLYQPLGQAISFTMGSTRLFTSGMSVISANTWSVQTYQVMQVGLAAIALAGTCFHFTLGLYLTNIFDLLTNLIQAIENLIHQNYKQAGEECLQALCSIVYLAIMITGSLEVILASLLLQAVISFYQSREEYGKGRIPEVIAKSLMGMIRMYQAGCQGFLIQRRNDLAVQYEEMITRVQKGRKIDHLWDHPLVQQTAKKSTVKFAAQKKIDPFKNHPLKNLSAQIHKHQVIFTDANDVEYDFGSHFYGYGKKLVKGMNVSFKEDGEKTTLDFKINHVFRNRLEEFLTKVEKTSQEDLKDLFKLFGSHVQNITIHKIPNTLNGNFNLGQKYEIDLQGLGKMYIGGSKAVTTLYDRVSVEMQKGKNLYDFHEALSFFNLEDALRQSANEDFDRMKMGHLFRTFNPKAATLFERSDPYFDLSLDEFKQEIFKLSPDMKTIFEKWIPKMELHEILPGKMRFSLKGLSDELKKEGAIGLTSVLTGSWTEAEMFQRVASMLKMGMLSSEMRYENGIQKGGMSSGTDFYTGGADSVFAQIVTTNNKNYASYYYQGAIRFLISPKILDTGTYQYNDDSYGNRSVEGQYHWLGDYLNRPNIFNFIKQQKNDFNGGNEVMTKDRIPPDFFTGIVLKNESTKQHLIQYLKEKDLIQKNELGQETIFSRTLDHFFYVGNQISENQFV